MRYFRKSVSVFLVLVMLICVLPFGGINANAASVVTENTFQSKYNKFKSDKYPDGVIYTNNPSATGGYECFGYANEIAKYIYGSYPYIIRFGYCES